MRYLAATLMLLAGLYGGQANAQLAGEAGELSPEALDAAFSVEDAAREAAAFSDVIIDQGAVDPLRAMTDAADLVFRGQVNSQSVDYGADGIPYTRTTFAIGEILKGTYPAGEISLVQEGGPDRHRKNKILLVSSSHLFNIGSEELLFIDLDAGNSRVPDRVAVNQRYRIFEGRVYTEDGRGVTVEPMKQGLGRRLMLSDDRHPSEYFRQIRIGDHTLRRNLGRDDGQPALDSSPEASQAHADSILRSYTASVDIKTFSEAITK